MLNHISIAVSDIDKSMKFYEAVLAPLGYHVAHAGEERAILLDSEGGAFALYQGKPFPFHFAFDAKTKEAISAWYDAALANGGTDNGAPGFRLNYHEHYYAAFVIDPDGYKIEAVNQEMM
ncbi:MAG: VOC family protein [Streptococcaceae bacterium]|nr:VOC family protein [Streptococcaceae bacterium]